MHNFKNLKIWQKAMDLADLALYYIVDLPSNERFNLICERRKYGDNEKLKQCLALTSEVQKMIYAFRDNLN